LVLLPSLFLFSFNISFKQRIRYFLISHALNVFLALGLVLAITIHGDLSMKSFGRLQEVFTLNLYDELTGKLLTKAAIMSDDVLGKYLKEFAVQGLLLTFLYVIFVKSISAAGYINLIMAIFTIKNRTALVESKAYSVLSYAALISLANMALIITKVFVLSSRYVVGFAFVLMIFASLQFAKIIMNYAHQPEKPSKSKWLAIMLILFMLLSLLKNILPKPEGYNYMQDAASWVKTHNKDNKPVFSDESRIRYYLGSNFTRNNAENWKVVAREIESNEIQNYDYLLISHSAKYPEREKVIAEKLPQYRVVSRFYSVKSKKSIIIYQKKPN
jgi:hypothetical protein